MLNILLGLYMRFQLGQSVSSSGGGGGGGGSSQAVQGLHDNEILATFLTHFASFTSRTTLGTVAVAGVVSHCLFFLSKSLYSTHIKFETIFFIIAQFFYQRLNFFYQRLYIFVIGQRHAANKACRCLEEDVRAVWVHYGCV
jgi:hypothetical protein